jgi:hypothetical protein
LLPSDVQAQRDLSISFERLGDLEGAEGNAAAARDFYRRALQLRQRLAELLPSDVQAQRDLSISFNKLGDLERAEGNAAAARDFYRRDLEIAERLAELLPTIVEAQRDLVVSQYKLWQFYLNQDLAAEATRHLTALHEQLRKMRSRQMPLDPPLANLLRRLDLQSENEGGSSTNPDS